MSSTTTSPNGDTSSTLPLPTDNPTDWNDVTNILDSITSEMDLGQMIHLSDFSLHSSMSALEIGDGVLDAAMKERRLYIENILNNETLLLKLFSIDSSNKLLLSIFDELIKLLWSFFDGNSDQFSIYSCLYLYDEIRNHKLNTNKTEILYLFIDSIILCCGYGRHIVLLSGIAQDEDWSKTNNYKLNLNFQNVESIIKQLENKIKNMKMKLSENSIQNDEKDENMQYIEAIIYRFEFIHSLLNIMKEMHNITQILPLDQELKTNENDNTPQNIPAKNNEKTVNKKTTPINTNKKKSKRGGSGGGGGKKNKGKQKGKNKGKKGHLNKTNAPKKKQKNKPAQSQPQTSIHSDAKCGLLLINSGLIKNKCDLTEIKLNFHKEKVQNFKQLSSSLLRIVNHLIETCEIGQYKSNELNDYFDDRIGNNLHVHAPRKQRIPNKLKCFKLFNNWCKCLRFMTVICKLNSFDSFLDYLNAFNYNNVGQTNVIIRCFLTIIIEQFAKYNTFLWSGKPLIHFIQLSFNYLCQYSRIFVTTNKQYLCDYITFFSRVETAIKDIVRQKLLHITRQMDWTKRIVKNWQILQTESPEIDRLTILSYRSGFHEKYHLKINTMDEYKCIPNPYSSWIIDKCCDSMINYIKIHLNKYMKLYADYEIEYVYYYLEYLFRHKTQIYINVSLKRYQKVNLERLNELINPNYAKMKARKMKKNKSNKTNKQNENEKYKLLKNFEANDKYFYLINEAQRCLCLGIFELIQSFYQINNLFWNGLSDRNNNNNKKRLGDESLRFEHRFNIFNHVDQPVPISYKQYRRIMFEYNNKYKDLNVKFKQTEAQFDKSSKNFGLLLNTNKFKNIKSFQQDYITAARKVAIINKIFTSKLLKIVLKNDIQQKINIKHHFDIHPYYATFVIDDDNMKNKNNNNNESKNSNQ